MKLVSGIFFFLISAATLATDYVQPVQKVIEYDARYVMGMDGFYSTQERVTQQLQEERISKLESQLEVLIKLLTDISGKLNANGSNVPNDSDNADSGSSAGHNNPPADGDDLNPADGVSELDVKVYEIFSNKCFTCHGENKQEGGLQLVNKSQQELFYQDLATRVDIYFRTNGIGTQDAGVKAMPPGSPLEDSEVNILRLWLYEQSQEEK